MSDIIINEYVSILFYDATENSLKDVYLIKDKVLNKYAPFTALMDNNIDSDIFSTMRRAILDSYNVNIDNLSSDDINLIGTLYDSPDGSNLNRYTIFGIRYGNGAFEIDSSMINDESLNLYKINIGDVVNNKYKYALTTASVTLLLSYFS